MIDPDELTVFLEKAKTKWYSFANINQLKSLSKCDYKDFFDFWLTIDHDTRCEFIDLIDSINTESEDWD